MRIFKLICISSILFLIAACTYETNEEDKYPLISKFPDIDHPKYRMKPLHVGIAYYYISENYNISLERDSTYTYTIFIKDGQLNSITTISADHITFINEDESLFIWQNEVLYQYSPPEYNIAKVVRETPLQDFTDSLLTVAHKNGNAQPTRYYLDSLKNQVYKNIYSSNLSCFKELTSYPYIYLLVYEDHELLIKTKETELQPESWGCERCARQSVNLNTVEIKPFDKVTLGYHVVGSNHIAFGTIAEELHYYRLIHANDTLLFKDSYGHMKVAKKGNGTILFFDGKGDAYVLEKR